MKKVFAILLTVCFLAAMSACGDTPPPPVVPEEPQVETTVVPCDEQEAVDGDEDVAEDVQIEEQAQE